jgi:hypothetical protein
MGEWATSLRGSRRVTVVARAEDRMVMSGLRQEQTFLPPRTEAKSALVLPICAARPGLGAGEQGDRWRKTSWIGFAPVPPAMDLFEFVNFGTRIPTRRSSDKA